MQFKQDVVRCANENSNRSCASRFKVDVKRVREQKRQMTRGGRKLTDVDLKESLLAWIYDRRSNARCVSREMIMFTAKSMYYQMNPDP